MPLPLAAPGAVLLRALAALRPQDEATFGALLTLLGHHLETAPAARRVAMPAPPAPRVARDAKREAGPAPESSSRRHLASDLVTLEAGATTAPPWMATATLLPLSSDPGAVFGAPMPPLLDPRLQRALLLHAAARRKPEGELDLERVTRAIVERQTLRDLPRRPVTSLRDGALLLLDAAPGMEPFAMDLATVTAALIGAVGRDRTRVERFYGCPTAGLLRWSDGGRDPWRPPPEGMPVLALTDLGATRVSGVFQPPPHLWRDLQALLRRRGSQLTILFPGSVSRVPSPLRGRLRIVPLDRATSVRTATGAAL